MKKLKAGDGWYEEEIEKGGKTLLERGNSNLLTGEAWMSRVKSAAFHTFLGVRELVTAFLF